MTIKLLIINPNSSKSITAAIATSLSPFCPPGVDLTFWNPSTGPPGIKDAQTDLESTKACMLELVGTETQPASQFVTQYDGVLVCCFSEHSLINHLSEYLQSIQSKSIVLGIFHAGIAAGLLLTSKAFGIIATGTGVRMNHYVGISNFLGVNASTCPRFVGSITTGLQVVELQDGDRVKVEKGIKGSTVKLVELGAEVIVLGCAGMCGMDMWLHEAAEGFGKKVRIVDSPRVGMQMLVALIGSR